MTAYSNSRINCFYQCPYKYKLQYIDRIKVEVPDTIETYMGRLVHEVMEKLYKDLQYQKKNTKKELLDYFEKLWSGKWSDKIVIVKKDYTTDNYKDMGRKYISDYYDRFKPFNGIKTLALETENFLDLEDGNKYHIRIDRLACNNDGNYYVCDYKTGGRISTQYDLDRDRQLAMYSLWVRQKYSDAKDVKLVWYFMAFDREMVSERTPKQLEGVKRDIENMIKHIESVSEFPTYKSRLCDWCKYKQMCPHFKHEYELKEKNEKEFKEDDGVKLVDEYTRLENEEKEANGKKEEIKQKIIKFSKQMGVDVVCGTDRKASIKSYSRLEYPKTDEFMELLKKKGLYDEVVAVNSTKLRNKLENGDIDIEVLVNLKAEKVWSLRMSNREKK